MAVPSASGTNLRPAIPPGVGVGIRRAGSLGRVDGTSNTQRNRAPQPAPRPTSSWNAFLSNAHARAPP
eukprot:11188415-Lingulodinium_polyedra.AAC.1